nr:hypothetical protein [Sinorhizobium meliloti]
MALASMAIAASVSRKFTKPGPATDTSSKKVLGIASTTSEASTPGFLPADFASRIMSLHWRSPNSGRVERTTEGAALRPFISYAKASAASAADFTDMVHFLELRE